VPEDLRRARETIAQLRAMAAQLEAELPGGDGNGDDNDPPAETARQRARRLGITVITGGAAGALVAAAVRWAQARTMPAALLLAGGAAAGGMALAPVVAPHVPGMPVPESSRGAAPASTVTYVEPPPPRRPGPTKTVTAAPAPAATATPEATPTPDATPSPSPTATDDDATGDTPPGGDGDTPPPDGDTTPRPEATPDPTPPGEMTPPAPPAGPPGGDGDTPPPGDTEAACALGVALPPLLSVCVLSDGAAAG